MQAGLTVRAQAHALRNAPTAHRVGPRAAGERLQHATGARTSTHACLPPPPPPPAAAGAGRGGAAAAHQGRAPHRLPGVRPGHQQPEALLQQVRGARTRMRRSVGRGLAGAAVRRAWQRVAPRPRPPDPPCRYRVCMTCSSVDRLVRGQLCRWCVRGGLAGTLRPPLGVVCALHAVAASLPASPDAECEPHGRPPGVQVPAVRAVSPADRI